MSPGIGKALGDLEGICEAPSTCQVQFIPFGALDRTLLQSSLRLEILGITPNMLLSTVSSFALPPCAPLV